MLTLKNSETVKLSVVRNVSMVGNNYVVCQGSRSRWVDAERNDILARNACRTWVDKNTDLTIETELSQPGETVKLVGPLF